MFRHIRIAATLVVAVVVPCLAQVHAGTVVNAELLEFAGQVRNCAPASATQPHPLMAGFTIEHTVSGPQDGRCGYIQTMPSGMRMECAFGDGGREAFARELEHTAATGEMSGSSSGPQPAWVVDCEIIDSAGKRIPMGG